MKVLKRIPLNIIIRYVVLLLVVFIIAKLTTGEEYNDSINEAPINATISSKDTGTTTVGTTKVILGDNNDEMVVSTLKSGETVTYTLRKNDKDDIVYEENIRDHHKTVFTYNSSSGCKFSNEKNKCYGDFTKRIKNPSRKLKNRFVSCMETRRFF